MKFQAFFVIIRQTASFFERNHHSTFFILAGANNPNNVTIKMIPAMLIPQVIV
jgi:hypothetical protein